MADRDRIDWANLEPLPRKKRKAGATREDLAERRFNVQKANHRGRNHVTNQKRRQMEREKQAERNISRGKSLEKFREYKAKVRLFWLGLLEDHP